MLVGFKNKLHDNGVADYLIAKATASDWVHSELIFPPGVSVSSWAGQLGVSCQWTRDTVKYPQFWEFYEVGEFDQTPMVNFLAAQMGKPYDWQSIFFTFALPLSMQNADQWTCSELTYYALAHYSPVKLARINPETPNPGQLRQLLIQAGYPRITS
ncbi:hypothetical protein GCM10028808_49950 [Spirosoma migulaei]